MSCGPRETGECRRQSWSLVGAQRFPGESQLERHLARTSMPKSSLRRSSTHLRLRKEGRVVPTVHSLSARPVTRRLQLFDSRHQVSA